MNQRDSDIVMAQRNPLYGLSILLIIFCHYGILKFGYVGVDIFVFLSGYSLARGYYEKELHVAPFYSRRFMRVYPTYWVVLIPYLFLYLGHVDRLDFSYILLNMAAYSNSFLFDKPNLVPGSWYLSLLLTLYVAYPVLHRLFKDSRNRFLVFMVLSLVVLLSQYLFIKRSMLMITLRIPLFLFGMYLSMLVTERDALIYKIKESRWLLPVVSTFLFLLLLFSMQYFSEDVKWHSGLLWWPSVILAPFCIYPIAKLLSVIAPKYLSILTVSGFCSLEMYLLHEPVKHIIEVIVDKADVIRHQYLLAVLLSLPATLLLSYIVRTSFVWFFGRQLLLARGTLRRPPWWPTER
jgi:peptidoglycan/LPS O-acetylase OafA/YrhL